jgi:hypothetical protein
VLEHGQVIGDLLPGDMQLFAAQYLPDLLDFTFFSDHF